MANLIDIKNQISDDDVYNLLEYLGGQPVNLDNVITSYTICHGGDSEKLAYYRDSKRFMCYTHCGNFDIFELIVKVKNVTFGQAVKFIEEFFHLDTPIIGSFEKRETHYESEIDNPIASLKHRAHREHQTLEKIQNENVLNSFYDFYYDGWIKEGISKQTMRKFGIKFSIIDNQIIIPHRDIDGDLVGIRARNLSQDKVDEGKKYIPIYYNGKSYRYPTGLNLYGLNINKDVINKTHQIVLFEAEKSVLKMDSFYGAGNSVALNGTMLGEEQVKLIDSLDVNEVIIAVDKEYDNANSEESKEYAKKMFSIFKKLKNRYNLSIIWDKEGLLNRKDSPVDQGKEVFEKLIKDRIII